MKLSNYVRVLNTNSKSMVLLNTIDKSIVELERKYFQVSNNYELIDTLPDDIYNALNNMGYFIDDNKAVDLIKTALQRDEKLIISVETTLGCNLRCPYCYQGLNKESKQLSDENIDLLIEYFRFVYKKAPYNELVLKILGGEPTIVWKKTKIIIDKAYEFCKENGVLLSLMLDTNGVIIKDILELDTYNSLLLTIPLTYKNCHDAMRKFANGIGTYDIIIENVNKIHELKPEVTIVLRHNTDAENINDFEQYISDLNSKLNYIPIIDLSYTTEIGDNNYINDLSYEDYKNWKTTEATDILIKYGFYVMTSPLMSMDRCQYRSKYSLKIFSDGTVGPCAMWFFKQKRYTIKELINNIAIAEAFYENNEKRTEKCKTCYSFFLCNCSYTLPCIQSLKLNECEKDGEFNIHLETFVKKYMQYAEVGKGDLFVGFTQAFPIR